MRKLASYLALGLVTAGEMAAAAQTVTTNLAWVNRPGRVAILNRRALATNTPAFEAYGLNLMLSEANRVREAWNLDIPQPLTASNVTYDLRALVAEVEGEVLTKDGRFLWQFFLNRLDHFVDGIYYPHSFEYNDDEAARLAKIESKITAEEAVAIARQRLHQLGLSEKQLELIEPPVTNGYRFEESDGKQYRLPLFHVAWKIKELLEHQPSLQEGVWFEVSGITRQVVEYSNYDPRMPRIAQPTNYLAMLGLPTNYLQTLSRRERMRVGMAPLTNTPSQTIEGTK